MDTELIHRIKLFIHITGTATTRIGRESIRDPRLVKELSNGRMLQPATRQKVIDWLDQSLAIYNRRAGL